MHKSDCVVYMRAIVCMPCVLMSTCVWVCLLVSVWCVMCDVHARKNVGTCNIACMCIWECGHVSVSMCEYAHVQCTVPTEMENIHP